MGSLQTTTAQSGPWKVDIWPFDTFCPHCMSALYFYNLPLLSRALPEWGEDSDERLRHITLLQCFAGAAVALMGCSCSDRVKKEQWYQTIYRIMIPVKRWKPGTVMTGGPAYWGQVYTLQIPPALPVLFSYYLSSRVGLCIRPQPTSLDCQTLRNKGTDAIAAVCVCGGGVTTHFIVKRNNRLSPVVSAGAFMKLSKLIQQEESLCLALTLIIKSNPWSLGAGKKKSSTFF